MLASRIARDVRRSIAPRDFVRRRPSAGSQVTTLSFDKETHCLGASVTRRRIYSCRRVSLDCFPAARRVRRTSAENMTPRPAPTWAGRSDAAPWWQLRAPTTNKNFSGRSAGSGDLRVGDERNDRRRRRRAAPSPRSQVGPRNEIGAIWRPPDPEKVAHPSSPLRLRLTTVNRAGY